MKKRKAVSLIIIFKKTFNIYLFNFTLGKQRSPLQAVLNGFYPPSGKISSVIEFILLNFQQLKISLGCFSLSGLGMCVFDKGSSNTENLLYDCYHFFPLKESRKWSSERNNEEQIYSAISK